jgi:hypothetical protein
MSQRELFDNLKEGAGGKYDQNEFIAGMKGLLMTARKALDATVQYTANPDDWDMKDPDSRPVKQPAVRRVLNALVVQGRALKKSRAYDNKDAFYILSDEELAEAGIEEDNDALRQIIAKKSARKKVVVEEDFDEDEFDEEDIDDDDD